MVLGSLLHLETGQDDLHLPSMAKDGGDLPPDLMVITGHPLHSLLADGDLAAPNVSVKSSSQDVVDAHLLLKNDRSRHPSSEDVMGRIRSRKKCSSAMAVLRTRIVVQCPLALSHLDCLTKETVICLVVAQTLLMSCCNRHPH